MLEAQFVDVLPLHLALRKGGNNLCFAPPPLPEHV
jgi:hypothetical protein